ncbi:alpha/beta fold hydrolase [Rhodococcus triatomae]|uniref:Pimeloyl-ACP methyl ester carboxylesterase n=1 Tax=Rhodococcus triatomae TaxID=300028 RepID=A0A1G8QY46_9NOCA|nr:alpha/beta fold hydrolase [Rhodococcus triatomae]QNG20755.1 alpha/beta fold hydrolase [Rhodococcus triatomae]QNG23328.1 alpha/beta fold hydrolase [Rhodococcus triatomae]SDJ09607.1 Pimeloyl-ACP methyl ester carboxylesterase [Rhodococcus triatomae]
MGATNIGAVRRVQRGPVELAVFEHGRADGPPLLLVHGWPDTHELWQHVIPHLADRFRVISYDSRGAGQSTVPADVASYRLAEMAADLFAVIDGVSPDEPVHVLAHDWGSVETWEAVCEPGARDRIASFTSVSGPNLDHLGSWVRRRLRDRSPGGPLAQAVASAYTVVFQVPGLATLPLRLWFSKHWPAFLKFFDGLDPGTVHTAPTLADDMVHGLKLYRANIRRHLFRPRERYTQVPVQLLLNRRDKAVRPVGYEDSERWVSDLRRTTIDSGHWSPFSHPGEVARATGAFVDEVIARRSTKGSAGEVPPADVREKPSAGQ